MTKTTYSNYEFKDSRDSDCTMNWEVTCDVSHRGETYRATVWCAGEDNRVYFTARRSSTMRTAKFHAATKDKMVAAMRKWARV